MYHIINKNMNVSICDKHKKDLFVALFQVLKNCSSLININFQKDKMHIQGMDKSHICLFDVNIQSKWFSLYEVSDSINICVDASIFHSIISNKSEGLNVIVRFETEDYLNIDLMAQELEHTKNEFNKYFKIPLADFDYEELGVPDVEYNAEFTISSKKICDIFCQMILFGNDINIKCNETKIDLITNGVTGEMLVDIPINDLSEFAILEGEEVDLNYSLTYINKMCLTNKLSNEIQFSISPDKPMRISYDLGDESSVVFFIAPKVV